ncbi:Zinc finger protein 418 [Papilio machaon]|uniref:Zinc finger protein 418 n=1 Tax=Papilio machaon TaxID=76193 RepID=A0A0N0PD92_PAPMA|nr:Zinc finger protein 418 [Papilio machaon]
MEPKLTNTASLKTYSRSKCWKVSNPKDTKSEPLTTKEAVKYLLQGSLKRRVCRFCLTATTSLSELDEILEVASSGAIFQVTIRDMVASFYPFQVSDDANFPNKICGKCLDKTINCYLFTQQCERAERAVRNCFIDISEKFDKLDPLERVKRRGRQKLNPNHNIIHVEHKNVIDYADPIINIVNAGSSLVTNNNDVQMNELECPRCWQVFTNVESLVNHEKIHPKSMWYNCKLCGNSFIKHSHYKKHMKQFHFKENPKINTEKQQFQCNECGFICEELENYLQHIEKHKFKNVLECLVEKKTDNLCGVCLDKGDTMTKLNETLCLHGGYPELSGEMTVATILTATIPEKSHKYDEFLVSKEANRVAITKRIAKKVVTTNTKHDDMNKATSAGDIAMKLITVNDIFCFSNPIKISNEIVEDIDETDSSMFEKSQCLDITSLHIDIDGKEDRVGVPFSFSNPIKILDYSGQTNDGEQGIEDMPSNIVKQAQYIEIDPDSDISTIPTLCMTCSIFKKAQCEQCIEKTSINEEGIKKSNVENKSSQDPCKMCWIFDKVGKCNYCEENIYDKKTKQNKDIADPKEQFNMEPEMTITIPNRTIEHENIPNQQNIEPEKVIPILKETAEPVEDNSTRKRKIESEDVLSSSQKNIEPENEIPSEQYVEPEKVIPILKVNLEPEEIITTRKRKIEPKEVIPNQIETTEAGELIPSRKRKIDPEIDVPIVKRSKWQCEICLTNNDNRERCFCCGEKKKQDNTTNFKFTFTKFDYSPKRNKNKQDAVKNNNYIVTNNNEENEKTEQTVIKDDKQEDYNIEVIKNDLIPNISLPNTEVVDNVIKEDANQNKIQNEEEMEVNFDDGNDAKIVGNVVKFDGNVAKFDIVGNFGKIDSNFGKMDSNFGKIDSNFGKIDSNIGKMDSNIGKTPVMTNMNFNFGTCSTFTPPMQSFTSPVIPSFNPISTMSPTQFSSLSFNIGTQDNKPRKMLKSMRHRRDRLMKK